VLNAPLTGKTRITSDLNIDSVEVMEVVMEVEERFHVNIPLNDLADVVTIEDLAAVISTRIGSR
jgi:acyl carrier protein